VVRPGSYGRDGLLTSIRRVVQSHHNQNVVFGVRTLNEVLPTHWPASASMILLNTAALALLLATSVLWCHFIW
jgi:hypothetical protein